MNQDLAGKSHWDKVYSRGDKSSSIRWKPSSYSELLLENVFKSIFSKYKPKKVLEIGCGNSYWLPYLANLYSIEVYGIDYSEEGVLLAKGRLKDNGAKGEIYCIDIFDETSFLHDKFDLVFSLGLIEHFKNTEDVISKITPFLSRKGVLFTEIPNFNYSFYYYFTFIYQPKQLYKHKPLSLDMLNKAYSENGLEVIEGKYLGFFSMDIVAWGYELRYDFFIKRITPFFKYRSKALDRYLLKNRLFISKLPFLSPFIYVIGSRRCVE
tara:strand:+ start:137 stop:934 length:798 start_codon:yes stop_codon:yes gene_type:complete